MISESIFMKRFTEVTDWVFSERKNPVAGEYFSKWGQLFVYTPQGRWCLVQHLTATAFLE